MSPYIISLEDRRTLALNMVDFDITENGFLPFEAPLARLPNPYYQQWETIASTISHLIQSRRIRAEVDQLPVLSTGKLHTKEEWRRAYVVLAFMTHAYIWGDDKPSETLPPAIAIPFAKVSKHLGLPPVATYAALCLWNYQPTAAEIDFTDPDSLRMMNNLTGTEDEAWFYLISVMVEAQGAPAISLMLDAIQAASHQDLAAVIEALQELQNIIDRLGRLLERMYERCKPATFYHEIRPMLAGSKNMGSAGLPRGVYYDYGNGEGEWMQLRGGSNAQSSLIQFFDAVLGVVHKSTGENAPKGTQRDPPFHEEMRAYMPGPHRRFLDKVTELANIQQLAFAHTSHPLQPALLEAYQTAISALSDFRGIHMQIVARYIIIPSRQASVPGKMNLAVASHSISEDGDESKHFMGTGGTDLVPFLKQTRAETDRAGELR